MKACLAQNYGDPAIVSLYRCTYGFIFLAVPHGGIDFDMMTQDMVKNNHPLAPLLQDLSTDSRILQDLSEDFKNLLEDRKILSFVEQNEERALERVCFILGTTSILTQCRIP